MNKRSKITYGNFQDPIGLVMRMLKSRKTAAYTALIRECLSLIVWPVDRLLKPQELTMLDETPPSTSLPVILVMGPPRSGSTFIYQVLATSLPVSYLNNFGALFSKAPLVASKFFHHFFKNPLPSFRSYYGNTEKFSDPNDGFSLWNRWLGNDRYAPKREVPQHLKEEMNHFFHAWTTTFKKPFINKNNRNTTCADILASSLDNAYFVFVKRDPVFVAQSLLLAREEIQGDRKIGWGLGCNHVATHHEPDAELHHVAEQVAWIYSKLEQQMQSIPSNRLILIDYESFCHDPNPVVLDIYERIWNKILSPSGLPKPLQPFKASQSIRLPQSEFDQLQRLVRHYLMEYGVNSKLAA